MPRIWRSPRASDVSVSTWFVASEPHGMVIGKWLALTMRYRSAVTEADVYLWCYYRRRRA